MTTAFFLILKFLDCLKSWRCRRTIEIDFIWNNELLVIWISWNWVIRVIFNLSYFLYLIYLLDPLIIQFLRDWSAIFSQLSLSTASRLSYNHLRLDLLLINSTPGYQVSIQLGEAPAWTFLVIWVEGTLLELLFFVRITLTSFPLKVLKTLWIKLLMDASWRFLL